MNKVTSSLPPTPYALSLSSHSLIEWTRAPHSLDHAWSTKHVHVCIYVNSLIPSVTHIILLYANVGEMHENIIELCVIVSLGTKTTESVIKKIRLNRPVRGDQYE